MHESDLSSCSRKKAFGSSGEDGERWGGENPSGYGAQSRQTLRSGVAQGCTRDDTSVDELQNYSSGSLCSLATCSPRETETWGRWLPWSIRPCGHVRVDRTYNGQSQESSSRAESTSM